MLHNNFIIVSTGHIMYKKQRSVTVEWFLYILSFLIAVASFYYAIVETDITMRVILLACGVACASLFVNSITTRWLQMEFFERECDIRSELWQMQYKDDKTEFLKNPWTNRSREELEAEYDKIQKTQKYKNKYKK